jgi:hypothetical protein
LTTAHANDRAAVEQTVLVSTGLLFLYCAGAILAPTIAAAMVRVFGPGALFAQNGVLHVALAGFALWRYVVRAGDGRPARAAAKNALEDGAPASEASPIP